MSTAPATIADLQALQASSAADSQSIKDKMDLMIGEYDQKIGLIEQNILGLGVTMDVKLNDIQRKIQDDQMNVIDQAAKRFVEIEVRAGNTSNDMQVIHQAAKDTFEQMRQRFKHCTTNAPGCSRNARTSLGPRDRTSSP